MLDQLSRSMRQPRKVPLQLYSQVPFAVLSQCHQHLHLSCHWLCACSHRIWLQGHQAGVRGIGPAPFKGSPNFVCNRLIADAGESTSSSRSSLLAAEIGLQLWRRGVENARRCASRCALDGLRRECCREENVAHGFVLPSATIISLPYVQNYLLR